jgi:hypothetical protein
VEKENRKRDIQLVFRVTEEEKQLIREKMRLVDMTNFRQYARQMATKGYIVNIDPTEMKNLAAELQAIDVNIKQILRHVDRMGEVYAADTEAIRVRMVENWDMVRGLLREALKLGRK